MTYDEFLVRVIDEGIAAARRDYADDAPRREGAVAGFEACRGRQPAELGALLIQAESQAGRAHWGESSERYWYLRCFALEVEWVCNVVSAILVNEGRDPIVPPTCRGVRRAAKIAGVETG